MVYRWMLAAGVLMLGGTMAAQELPPPGEFPPPPVTEKPLTEVPAAVRQNPGGTTPTFKVSTKIVVLDVVVTDRKGNLVTDQTRDDFTIVEDREPQAIRSFEPPSAHGMPAGLEVKSAADLKKIGDAPVTLLVLDGLNTPFANISFSRQALVKFLKSQPERMAQPTVLLMAGTTRFRQLHDYTQNRDELIDAVKKAPAEIPTKREAGRSGSAAVERMAQSLATLEQMAQASLGTPGRKNVIWVGEGFPSADIVGLDPQTAATIERAVKQCTDMLLAARITMFTINPTMNTTSVIDVSTPDDLSALAGDDGADIFAGRVQFQTLAPATGGRAFLSRNDMNNEIAEGISAGSTYYTLSYAPTNASDDVAKYRHIRILMKDKSLHATTRDGYYPPTAATMNIASVEKPKQAAAQLQLDISSAVNSAISYNGLDVKATHVGANYVLQVKGAGLDWHGSGDRQTAEASVVAAWYSAKGKLLGHSGKELVATRAGDAGDAAFALPVAVTPGATRLRFVVRDAVNGRMGTVDVTP